MINYFTSDWLLPTSKSTNAKLNQMLLDHFCITIIHIGWLFLSYLGIRVDLSDYIKYIHKIMPFLMIGLKDIYRNQVSIVVMINQIVENEYRQDSNNGIESCHGKF